MLKKLTSFIELFIDFRIDVTAEEDQKQKTRLLNLLAFVVFFAFSFYVVEFLIMAQWIHVLINLFFLILIPGFYYIFRSYHKDLLAKFWLFYMLPTVNFITFVYLYGDLGHENYMIVLLVMFIFIEENRRNIIFYVIFSFAFFVFIKLLVKYHDPVGADFKLIAEHSYLINVAFSFIFVTYFLILFKKEIRNSRRRIIAYANELDDKYRQEKQDKEEIEYLSRELNHRVKNNLQIISSFIFSQMENVKGNEARESLVNINNKIMSLSLVHQQLLHSGGSQILSAGDYMKKLTGFLNQTSGKQLDIEILTKPDNILLDVQYSVHLGLIINELFSNTVKHAMKGPETRVCVLLEQKENGLLFVKYMDNGSGFPSGLQPETNNSFGLGFVKTMVDSYDGTMKTYNNNGAVIEMILTLKK